MESRNRLQIVVCVLLLVAAACGSEGAPGDSGSIRPPITESEDGTRGEPDVVEWQEPSDYSFALDSRCGERTLIGLFAITVRDGEIADVLARDVSAEVALGALGPDGVPTLGELFDELNTARLQQADLTDVTFDPVDGHPTHIEIDWRTNYFDDEACYLISEYSVTE